MERDTWDDLWWLTLYVLSKACYFGYLIAGVAVSVGLGGLFLAITKSPFVGVLAAAWALVLTRVGMGYVQFAWNKLLEREDRSG